METIEKLRDITDERCKISGMSATVLDTRDLSNSEVVIYVAIAVVLCFIILQLALDSYVAPVFLLLNIGSEHKPSIINLQITSLFSA